MTLERKFWARRARGLFLLLALGSAGATACTGGDELEAEAEIGQLAEPLAREADLQELAAERAVAAPSAAEVRQLSVAKQVDLWPLRVDTAPGSVVVALTVSECTWLGGSVVFWASCGGTLMKCVGANGRELCIDKIAVAGN